MQWSTRSAAQSCADGLSFTMEAQRGTALCGGNYLAGQTNTRGEPNVIESITTFLACLSFVIGGAPASVVVLDPGA